MDLKFKHSMVYDPKLGRRRPNFHAIHAYGLKLRAEDGWQFHERMGGYISPDRSAIYFTHRSPYYGRVMKYGSNGNYRKTIATLWSTGMFRGYLSEMEKQTLRETGNRIRGIFSILIGAALFDAIIVMMFALNYYI